MSCPIRDKACFHKLLGLQQSRYTKTSIILQIQVMERSLFYSKYRGTVTDTLDPLGVCRIRALPVCRLQTKIAHKAYFPPVGFLVWIEFENGDSNFPI